MKVEKHITVNLGNYQSLKIGAIDADNFSQCNEALIKEIKSMDIDVSASILKSLGVKVKL